MPLYLVCVPTPTDSSDPADSDFNEKLSSVPRLSEHVELWDGVYFLDARVSSNEIAEDLGIVPSGLGLVIPVAPGSVSGRAKKSSVDWIKARSGQE